MSNPTATPTVHLSERDRALFASAAAGLYKLIAVRCGLSVDEAADAAAHFRARLLAEGGPAPSEEGRS
jgi:hypothetical protein